MATEDLVGPGPTIHRIAAAKTLTGRTIRATWTTGETVIIDLWPLIKTHRVFTRLRQDDAFFHTMQIGEWGHDVCWPSEPDCAIPVAYLKEYAVPA